MRRVVRSVIASPPNERFMPPTQRGCACIDGIEIAGNLR